MQLRCKSVSIAYIVLLWYVCYSVVSDTKPVDTSAIVSHNNFISQLDKVPNHTGAIVLNRELYTGDSSKKNTPDSKTIYLLKKHLANMYVITCTLQYVAVTLCK